MSPRALQLLYIYIYDQKYSLIASPAVLSTMIPYVVESLSRFGSSDQETPHSLRSNSALLRADRYIIGVMAVVVISNEQALLIWP